MSNPHTTKPGRSARTLARRPNQWLIVWAVLICLAGGLMVAGRIVFVTRQSAAPADEHSSPTTAVSNNPTARLPHTRQGGSPLLPSGQALLVEDDGHTLWVSPTEGPSLDLSYLPPGAQMIVALRVQAIAAHSEGEKMRAALGPLGERAIEYVEQAAHLKWHEINNIVAAFQATSDGNWRPTFVVHTEDTLSRQLLAGLTGAAETQHGGEPYWIAGGRAYYLPGERHRRVLVIAPMDAIADIIDLAGETPPLRRDIERLLAHTDADRHVTIVFTPNSLFSEGRGTFDGAMGRLLDPLFWFLGDELSAAALSMHWDDDFFLELLATPTLDTSPERAARILAERVEQVPDKLEQYVVSLDAHRHGRDLVRRFPAMVRQLVAYTRRGFEPDYAVLRCYLPAVAGHNLLMGVELTLAENPSVSHTVAEATAPSAARPTTSRSARERLQRVTSLRFARDTLQAALEQLAQDIGVPFVIRGADLQAEGITKNQSFAIDLANKPAEEILVEILRLANPDKTATGPSDPRQKLVYVISPTGPGAAEQVIVTTRAAATERGEVLPPVFTQNQP
jgi:hypothetical protein